MCESRDAYSSLQPSIAELGMDCWAIRREGDAIEHMMHFRQDIASGLLEYATPYAAVM